MNPLPDRPTARPRDYLEFLLDHRQSPKERDGRRGRGRQTEDRRDQQADDRRRQPGSARLRPPPIDSLAQLRWELAV